jgi:quinol monooxygenase YgiN
MSVTMIRAKVKPENIADIEASVKAMFAAIEQAKPQGIRYSSYRLPDGTSYLILLELDEGIDNPLPGMPAFRSFQENLKGWLAEPPATEPLTTLGAYTSF